ncbi:MAG TPA: SDR family oxidoreductase [bacterium]|nr:SDR family oxidoreductase [bacterium]
MRGLSGKPAIVTGGASGIGRAICQRLGEEGCKVGIFDLNAAGANETAEAIRKAGGTAFVQAVDITDYDAVAKAVAAFEQEAGPTAVLVNNAGWDQIAPFLDTDLALWDKVIAINLRGPLNLHHVVLRGMADRREGRVVNIASDAARVGSSGEAVYAACKGGIVAFTKTMAREMARSGVVLNVICPGPTDTPLFAATAGAGEVGAKIAEGLKRAIPLKRLGRPEDLPGAVAFLVSDDAAFITGQVLSVSGGLTMAG